MKFFAMITVAAMLLNVACNNPEKKRKAIAYPDKIYSPDSLNIHYTKDGAGDTTLFFIHGWAINHSYWSNQVSGFSARYKVVTVDLPGFGASEPGRKEYTIEKYADDIAAVIDQLNLENVILIGHSMSGDIIIEALRKHPQHISGLVGIDNFQDVGRIITLKDQQEIQNFMDALKKSYQQTAGTYADQTLFHKDTDTAIRKKVINDIKMADSTVAISALEGLLKYQQQERTVLQQLTLPLKLVNSDANPVDTMALAKFCRSGFQVFYVPSTGHYPMIEKPEEFNRALQNAINSIPNRNETTKNR
jgi:pimeloyl-ACP methyl ester carboxylesterase